MGLVAGLLLAVGTWWFQRGGTQEPDLSALADELRVQWKAELQSRGISLSRRLVLGDRSGASSPRCPVGARPLASRRLSLGLRSGDRVVAECGAALGHGDHDPVPVALQAKPTRQPLTEYCSRARVQRRINGRGMDFPSTTAFDGDGLLVVDFQYQKAEPSLPFTVVRVRR